MILINLPDWVLFHIPHSAKLIPQEIMGQFALKEDDLHQEALKMTDHFTLELFGHEVPEKQIVASPVSRLVVDVERFEDDTQEPMSVRGMGVVYMKTSEGKPLRYPISEEAKKALIKSYYTPHHERLHLASQTCLDQNGRVLIIDAHSFPSRPLPYELSQELNRPEICIGTDDTHTSDHLLRCFQDAFNEAGFDVRVNTPFSGALVPLNFYGANPNAQSIMIEVRRDLYLNELEGVRSKHFEKVRQLIQESMGIALIQLDA